MAVQVLLYFVATLVGVAVGEPCESPWLHFQGKCYYFHNVTATLRGHSWSDSQMICESFGGNLVSITNADESNLISGMFNLSWVKRTQNYWIGLNDRHTESKFVWSDGSPFNTSANNFSNWRTSHGEPNDYGNNEDCVEVSYDGQWNDNKCYHRLGFICKRGVGITAPTRIPPTPPVVTDSPRTCEAGWVPWGTSCYGLIMGIPKTWEDARSDCQRRFGDLVIIEKKAELEFLTSELGKYSSEFWIGLTDENHEGVFRWVNQMKLNDSLQNWRKGEPSNNFNVENCVQMYGKYAPGKWNDNYCKSIHDYVCEKQSGVHNCPQGWVTHGDNCYQINAHPNQRMKWEDAHRACKDFNKAWESKIKVAEAELVSVLSEGEKVMIYKAFRNMGLPGVGNYYWMGLHRNSTLKHDWYWTDRSTFKYKNWYGSQAARNFRCVKSSLANEKSSWFAANCEEKNNYVCKVRRGQDRCFDPMGMQNFEIPDSAMTTNSQLNFGTPAHAARLYLRAGRTLDGAWCATNQTKRPYLQIDFGSIKKLTYMAMQGKSNSDAMVTAFYFTYSLDGISYDTYGNYPPARFYKFRSHLVHRGKNYEKVMNLPLPAPLIARYVRIYPLDWHISCCMRLEFYGCEHTEENQKCGLGWVEDPATGHCYKFNTQRTSLDAANGLCLAQGSQLLSISSLGEKQFIVKQLQSLSGRYSDYWIGLTDLDHEGMFEWIDESPLTLTNWYKNNPRLSDTHRNCVTIRAVDGFWVNVDCTSYRTFICKRTYKRYKVKKLMSNNWRTQAAFYWPLQNIANRKAIGTIPGLALGNFTSGHFPYDFNARPRYYISLDGKTSQIEIPNLDKSSCVANPDAEDCHGVSVSLLLWYKGLSMKAQYIVDTMGQRGRNSVGYSIFIKGHRLHVMLRGHDMYYNAYALIATRRMKWLHIAFTWNTLKGLRLYLNGLLQNLPGRGRKNDVTAGNVMGSMFVGRSATSRLFTKMDIMSLAVFDRWIEAREVIDIYKEEFGSCGWGQVSHGSYCYEFNSTALNYVDALTSCQLNQGNLVSIHSTIEQSFVSHSIGYYGLNNSETWIGFNANKDIYVYNWTDGSPVSFTFWGPFEPNNYRGRGESCVNTVQGGYWNDNLCFLRKSFACKYQRQLAPTKPENERTYSTVIYFFQTRTFGCTLSKKIELVKVLYGNEKEGCFIPLETAKNIVQKDCAGQSCRNVRATDSYFNKSNPCKAKRLATKKLVVTYKCVDDGQKNESNGCPEHYSAYSKYSACYRLYQERLSVSDASTQCRKEGGELASIAGWYEELYLTTLMGQLYQVTDVWIGMSYNATSQTFTWMDGRRVIYTNWYNQYPDPRNGKFVVVSVHRGSDRFIFWNTANATEKHPYFCRKWRAATPTVKPPAPTVKPSGKCPPKWELNNNYCYWANPQPTTFSAAQFQCKRFGATLASITSAEENGLLLEKLTHKKNRWFSTWIGLTNEAIVKGYRWLDQTPLDYINWYSTTPYTGSRHLCVGMNSGGKWWDLPCHSRYPFFCKMRLEKVKPTTTPSVPITLKPGLCGSGWTSYKGSCYYFSQEALDYHQASQKCFNLSSYLVSVTTLDENRFINIVMRLNYSMKSLLDPPLYIGLHDISTENGWEWTDRSLVKFVNWEKNQPDDWHGEEDCVAMRYNGKWNDVSCSLKLRFACKKHNKTVLPTPTKSPPPNTGKCDDGWILYGNKCYLFKLESKDRRNQKDAKDYCRQFGKNADLVSIHHNYVNSFLLSQLREATYPVYIGLGDYMKEGTFGWTDQTSVDYTNWYLRQPSRYLNEDCVELFPFYLYRGTWNDIHCHKRLPFICHKDSDITTTPRPVPKSDCPGGYEKYAGNCYQVFTEKLSWVDAQKECAKEKGGNLVSFHDPYHQAFVFSRFVTRQVEETWIGLYKKPNEGTFHWSDGSILDYNHWKNGQIVYPNKNSDSCVSQVFSSELDGRWVATRNCSEKLPFTCKILKEKKIVVQYEGSCAKDWTMYGKTCYRYFKSDRASWPEAREKCKRFGGDLATVDSKQVQSILLYLVRSSFATVWIGLNDRDEEHVWRWSSGAPYSVNGYTNWGDREPNDNSGIENCVEIYSATGKWNDLPCRHRHPYICEHSLECRKPLGMENGTIPDDFITASNYTENFLPKFARLRATTHDKEQTSWCTSILDGKQNLTINLGGQMHVTLIQTQGMFPYHVISYKLFYSEDGKKYTAYTEEKGSNPEPRILPGNEKGSQIEGVKVNLHATYVRFMPVLFKTNLDKNLVCMRVELLGCKSVCLREIKADRVEVSSNEVDFANVMRLTQEPIRDKIFSDTGLWCSKASDKNPFIKISFSFTMTVNRIVAYGNGTKEFVVHYGLDGDLKEYNNGKAFATSQRLHDLESPLIAQNITIKLSGESSIAKCLQIELYGCEHHCKKALGLEEGVLPNGLITSSSYLVNHEPYKARLNAAEGNYWRPSVVDQGQYLEIDFTKADARVTGIATQGCGSDSYVKSYYLQWSKDKVFWHHSKALIYGNIDDTLVKRVVLKEPIAARYLRINPYSWNNFICLRVEVYGCPLGSLVVPPKPRKAVYVGNLHLTDEEYSGDLADHRSARYRALERKVLDSISKLYLQGDRFKDSIEVIVNGFKPGSVLAEFTVIITDPTAQHADVVQILKNEIKKGHVGKLNVDTEKSTMHRETSFSQQESQGIVYENGLSEGGKIGLLVFFFLMIASVLIAGTVFYLKRTNRGFKLQFAHKNFDNPVDFTPQEYGDNVHILSAHD